MEIIVRVILNLIFITRTGSKGNFQQAISGVEKKSYRIFVNLCASYPMMVRIAQSDTNEKKLNVTKLVAQETRCVN